MRVMLKCNVAGRIVYMYSGVMGLRIVPYSSKREWLCIGRLIILLGPYRNCIFDFAHRRQLKFLVTHRLT